MSDAEQAGEDRQDKGARLLAGRYRLGDVLGRGGMGTVWRALDETLGRTVAVKELRFPSTIDDDEKRRLITRTLREAKAIARIRNTSAVTVFDVVDEDDRPWIVMELVEGSSLAEVIREDGVLTPKRAAEVGLAVLDVLRSAHREGILHRDVKPSNVLIAEDGRVVLTDFGIAQVEGDPSITSTGMLVGAPSYISPERARGHRPGPAADLWSLGGLLYAAVEGVPPYDKGSAIATLTAVMTEPLGQPKNAGPLENVIYGLLAKDPEQRLDDAGARKMLTEVLNAPDPAEPEPADATRAIPLPPLPAPRAGADAPAGAPARGTSSGAAAAAGAAAGRKSEEAAERLRGALRSVRKAAAREESPARPDPQNTSARRPGTGSGSGPAAGGAVSGAGRGAASGAAPGEDGTAATSGVPKASLTDVVPRRTLVIIAVIVALVVLGTVLALTQGGGGDGKAEGKGSGGDKATTSTAAGGADGRPDGADDGKAKDGKGEDQAGTGAPDGSADDPGKGKDTDPAKGSSTGQDSGTSGKADGVAQTYRDKQGFSIGLPEGWKYRSTDRAGSRFTGPDGQTLLVGWTTSPKSDPVADWENQERYMVRSQYHRLSIEKVGYRGWNTADWVFTYVENSTKYRSVDRGFVVGPSLGYGMLYRAKDADWNSTERRDTWDTLTRTFEPKS